MFENQQSEPENTKVFWTDFEKTLCDYQIELIEKTDFIDTRRVVMDEKKEIWKTWVMDTGRQARVYLINGNMGVKVLEPDCSAQSFDTVPILATIKMVDDTVTLCDTVSLSITEFQNINKFLEEIKRLLVNTNVAMHLCE